MSRYPAARTRPRTHNLTRLTTRRRERASAGADSPCRAGGTDALLSTRLWRQGETRFVPGAAVACRHLAVLAFGGTTFTLTFRTTHLAQSRGDGGACPGLSKIPHRLAFAMEYAFGKSRSAIHIFQDCSGAPTFDDVSQFSFEWHGFAFPVLRVFGPKGDRDQYPVTFASGRGRFLLSPFVPLEKTEKLTFTITVKGTGSGLSPGQWLDRGIPFIKIADRVEVCPPQRPVRQWASRSYEGIASRRGWIQETELVSLAGHPTSLSAGVTSFTGASDCAVFRPRPRAFKPM
jgi:hypothetical protein